MWPFDIFKRKEQDANERSLHRAVKRLRYSNYQLQYHYDYVTGYRDWSSHIYNTRKYICDCARRCFGRRSCVVLGSGFCLDVPVLELSRMFDNVFLVDIHHPKRIRQRIHENKNVQLVTEDITKIAVEAINSINHCLTCVIIIERQQLVGLYLVSDTSDRTSQTNLLRIEVCLCSITQRQEQASW